MVFASRQGVAVWIGACRQCGQETGSGTGSPGSSDRGYLGMD